MSININVNETLESILKNNNIEINDYQPAYGGESVGLDLYNASDRTFQINNTLDARAIVEKVLIPTGLRIALPKGHVALLRERGSVIKTNLQLRAGVIDPGYTDEIFVNLWGSGTILPGEKLPVQLIVVKAETEFSPLDMDSYLTLVSNSKRKDGKVGSSN